MDKNTIGGVIVAAITPRRPDEIAPDLGATLDLIDFLTNNGANGIALFGSTGEFVHFSLDDRRQTTALAAKRCGLPLLVNVSHSTLGGAVELACAAADSYVAGVLLMPPYYFRYSQQSIKNFFLDFARQVPRDLPIYLYNIPLFTNEIDISTALILLDSGRFAGIKDSSGSWDYFIRLRDHATTNPYTILIGADTLFARARACGADGVISGVACAVPELMVGIEAAVAAGEAELARVLDVRVGEFVQELMRFPLPMAIKEAVRLRRIKAGPAALELSAEEQDEMEQFRRWFVPWLSAVQEDCMVGLRRKRGR